MSLPSDFADADLDGFPVAAGEPHSRDTVELLASEFAERVRRGECPSVELYVARHPQFADELRELLPMVATLEEWKVHKEAECLRRSLPEDFSPGRLGDCRIIREIGRGGMGVVYEAVEDGTGRRVAVKLLPWRFAAALPRWWERFRREAITIGNLRHRNIVPVYRFAEDKGYCYYVMQLVEGVDLREIVSRLQQADAVVHAEEIRRTGRTAGERPAVDSEPSPFRSGRQLRRDSWTGFAKIGVQVAQALDYAHRLGVLHHDVKPGNLLLDANGQVFITDFGIARGPDGASGGDDPQIGTLRYMAPERLGNQCDPRSDVYSLGATLYELVTRSLMFNTPDRTELVRQICHEQPRRPRAVVPQIPRALEAVILQAIAQDPDRRYPSAAALAADLLRFVNGLPVTAGPQNWWQRLWSRFGA